VLKTKSAKPSTKKVALRLSPRVIADLADVFGMLADGSRLKILLALAQAGEMHVSALCDLLGQSQPAVSHHLTLLRAQHLVGYRREGKHNFYRVDSDRVHQLFEEFFAASGNGQQQLQFPGFSLAYKSTNGNHARRR
jgi:ArsR family transcriptional regulator